jgi:trans-aconitate 2-methyltransferase
VAAPRDWDAVSYAEQGRGVRRFGQALIGDLELRGDEVVLDAGCGDGGVTRELLERVPDGRVYAVDGSPAMVERARAALDADPRATVLLSDLLELELPEPVDVAFSSATFHWIADHDALFARLHAALRPGGRLLAQCGGAGNIATVRDAVAAVDEPALRGWEGPWNFATPQDTVARLERAGFAGASAGLHEETVHTEDPAGYLATMILGSHCDRLPASRRDGFLAAVAARLPDPLDIKYVRLTMRARRPA